MSMRDVAFFLEGFSEQEVVGWLVKNVDREINPIFVNFKGKVGMKKHIRGCPHLESPTLAIRSLKPQNHVETTPNEGFPPLESLHESVSGRRYSRHHGTTPIG